MSMIDYGKAAEAVNLLTRAREILSSCELECYFDDWEEYSPCLIVRNERDFMDIPVPFGSASFPYKVTDDTCSEYYQFNKETCRIEYIGPYVMTLMKYYKGVWYKCRANYTDEISDSLRPWKELVEIWGVKR